MSLSESSSRACGDAQSAGFPQRGGTDSARLIAEVSSRQKDPPTALRGRGQPHLRPQVATENQHLSVKQAEVSQRYANFLMTVELSGVKAGPGPALQSLLHQSTLEEAGEAGA